MSTNKKMLAALLSTFAFGAVNLAHAEDAPKDAKPAKKGAKKGKDGEKSCSGEKGCGAKK